MPSPPDESADESLDAPLLRRAAAGDPEAFDALVDRHGAWVLAVARRAVGAAEDAEDVTQEAFLTLLRHLPTLELAGGLRAWLYPVTWRLGRDLRRRRVRYVDDGAVLEAALAPVARRPAEERRELAAALAGLPEEQREALLLRHVDGLDVAETARAQGVPEGTVRSRVHHALRALRADPRARRHFLPDGEAGDRGEKSGDR